MRGWPRAVESVSASLTLSAVGAAALALGVLVYLTDRGAASAPLIPSIDVLGGADLFGAAAAWLPSFLHPLAFILFTAAVALPSASPPYWTCLLWLAIDVMFEAGQLPAASERFSSLAREVTDPTGGLVAIARYLQNGTYDPADIAATVGGVLVAGVVLHVVLRRRKGDEL